MGHRTGFVNGEADGSGVQTDIPRRLWARNLSQVGLPSYLATYPGFWVGHLLVPAANVVVSPVQRIEDLQAIQFLLNEYKIALEQTYQYEQAERVQLMGSEQRIREDFVRITAA